ncbi:MAG: class I SAM-dependent methyltransferase [Planctomycetota bacterium]
MSHCRSTPPAASDGPRDWDARFASEECHLGTDPEAFVVGELNGVRRGLALDVACGEGRHAVALAKRGFRTVAVDRSLPGVRKLLPLARKLGAPCELLYPVVADILTLPLPLERFQLILNVNFLDRALFSRLVSSLAPGGVLLVQSFGAKHPEVSEHGPKNPQFLLQPDEILELVRPLQVTSHEEVIEPWSRGGRRAVVRVRAEKETRR